MQEIIDVSKRRENYLEQVKLKHLSIEQLKNLISSSYFDILRILKIEKTIKTIERACINVDGQWFFWDYFAYPHWAVERDYDLDGYEYKRVIKFTFHDDSSLLISTSNTYVAENVVYLDDLAKNLPPYSRKMFLDKLLDLRTIEHTFFDKKWRKDTTRSELIKNFSS
jgi:hypothetical protein